MFYEATKFSQVLCWELQSSAVVEDMLTGSAGTLREDCDMSSSFYNDIIQNIAANTHNTCAAP
jgi:hypothetical protein